MIFADVKADVKQQEARSARTTSVCFFVVTVNDEHTKLGLKESLQRLNLKMAYAPNCA